MVCNCPWIVHLGFTEPQNKCAEEFIAFKVGGREIGAVQGWSGSEKLQYQTFKEFKESGGIEQEISSSNPQFLFNWKTSCHLRRDSGFTCND